MKRDREIIHALDPDDPFTLLVAGDWLEEHGRDAEADAFRRGAVLPPSPLAWDGSGYGDGYGHGYGSGSGSPYPLPGGLSMDELIEGQAYLWMVTNGWMFVGRFVRRDGLFGCVISDVTNICRTGGTAWPDLCQGKGRAGATFRRWPDATPSGTPFPVAFPFMRWEGAVPG